MNRLKKESPQLRIPRNSLHSSKVPWSTTWLFWWLTRINEDGEVMVSQGLTRRFSKLEAAAKLEVSPTTIDRMIARGELQTEREAKGSRYKVWVLLPEEPPDFQRDGSEDVPTAQSGEGQRSTPGESEVEELIRLRLQVKNLEDLANYRHELLNEAGKREQLLMDQLSTSQKNLEAVTLALNPGPATVPPPRRTWWPWRRKTPQGLRDGGQ